jgi:hypothetical protein
MCIGDLVFCHGYRGLILETSYGMYSTEHFIYWFNLGEEDPTCWVSQKQLTRIT